VLSCVWSARAAKGDRIGPIDWSGIGCRADLGFLDLFFDACRSVLHDVAVLT
jgi:hypothetical protein